ncbi:MAG: hypothetical protein WCH59_10430 [Chitinophagia bacterium]|jgi:hypothetical protein
MKYWLIMFACVYFGKLNAQSDWLVLKKKERTLQSWTVGSYIIFRFSNQQWIEGFVRKVQQDSVWINQVHINRVFNNMGFFSFDTSNMGIMRIHVNEISAVPKKNFSYNIFSNGKLFQLGSAAFIFLNVFNSAIHREPVFASDNVPRLGVAGGIFLLGTLLASSNRTYWEAGKKYHFAILQLGTYGKVQLNQPVN